VAVGRAVRIGVFRLLENDDLIEAIKNKAEESNIKAGAFILIGSIKQAVLGYYKDGEYKNTVLQGPLEVASCMGNVALDEKGEVVVHAHVVVTNEKSEAFGGHLMKDSPVGATAELVMIEATGIDMQRIFDEKTKLRLLKLT
jgi:predicted DNA-binding protein with PD1-like motif